MSRLMLWQGKIVEHSPLKEKSIDRPPIEPAQIAATLAEIPYPKTVLEETIKNMLTQYSQTYGVVLDMKIDVVDVTGGQVYQVTSEAIIQ